VTSLQVLYNALFHLDPVVSSLKKDISGFGIWWNSHGSFCAGAILALEENPIVSTGLEKFLGPNWALNSP
jgi:hypothetical protein